MDLRDVDPAGWNATIFPPYFVAGRVLLGSGGDAAADHHPIGDAARALHHPHHLDRMARITLSPDRWSRSRTPPNGSWPLRRHPNERFVFVNRATGPYGGRFWTMVCCNAVVPQVLCSARTRESGGCFQFGPHQRRHVVRALVIIVTSLHRSYLPSSWVIYTPTPIEIGTLIGSFRLFFTCFLFFIRLADERPGR